MFESAEIGHTVDRASFRAREPQLRAELLTAQYDSLAQARFPVVVLVNGVDGAGKGETVNLLNEWMDPRHIRTEAFGELSPWERQRPEMWRFWQVLPPKGRMAVLFGSWYSDPILARVMHRQKPELFAQRLESIRAFELMLVAEGALIVKFWFHLSRKAARKRFKALEADPTTAWQVRPEHWEHLEQYDAFVQASAQALRRTSTAEAPWLVVEGFDPAYRALTVGEHLLAAWRQRLDAPTAPPPLTAAPPAPALDGRTLLGALDYSQRLDTKTYEARLPGLQARLNGLMRHPGMTHRSWVLVFEGMDAAGKGSTIRRITQALDARHYRVIPVAAPSDEERAQPYLWRFWRQVPAHGHAAIFDRSWYGRVLVERVEGFCSQADWMRAYDEINAFEEQLASAGAVVVKFWLSITPQEQLRRFEQRRDTPHKRFKITDEDWRNRDRWPQYERAVGDMVDRTSTELAPWHVVATDDKRLARVTVLQTLCERVEAALKNGQGG